MRTWTRAAFEQLCGGPCRRKIRKGEPVLQIRIAALSRDRMFRRCVDCAGEPVPERLPPLVEALPLTPQPLTRFGRNMLPLDWKAKQSGEREPGQEG